MKTVIVRFRHNGNLDRATEAKARKNSFDEVTGAVKLKVQGPAEENKKIDSVRSRFIEGLSGIQRDKRAPDSVNFKATYPELERYLEIVSKELCQLEVMLLRTTSVCRLLRMKQG